MEGSSFRSSQGASALFPELRMKRHVTDRGGGETSAKALCTGISSNNAKRAGPFILGKLKGIPQTAVLYLERHKLQAMFCGVKKKNPSINYAS